MHIKQIFVYLSFQICASDTIEGGSLFIVIVAFMFNRMKLNWLGGLLLHCGITDENDVLFMPVLATFGFKDN